jgi:hypothetical protein
VTAASPFAVGTELAGDIRRWGRGALIVGALALIVCIIGAFFWPQQFFRSYLWSYLFFVGISVGCVAVLMLQYLTGGAWGIVIRRICEAAARTLPLVALMFIPVLVGMKSIYLWSHPDVVAADEVMRHKQMYLNVPFFVIRAVVYFAGWGALAYFLNKWSARQDQEGANGWTARMSRISGPGLVFWGFSVTFMAIDWVLSISPHWFSTIYGMLFMAGQGLTCFAFVILMVILLANRPPLEGAITHRHLHDLGKLMLTFVMVWAYFSFSQFLIIWSGNLPSEITWYVERLRGGWGFVGLGLVFLHFALPFALLLSRDVKRNYKLLTWIAVLIVFMRLVDLYWNVAPDYRKGAFGVSWMDILLPVGLGGVWLWYFAAQLPRRPLLPVNDPHLEEALEHGRE